MKWEPARLWTRGLDLIMTKFPSGSHSLWLYFQVPLALSLVLQVTGLGLEVKEIVFPGLHLPDMTVGLVQHLCKETQPGWHWALCVKTGEHALAWWAGVFKTLHHCLLWAIDKRSSQMPAARCWGARVVRAKHVAWIFSEQVVLRQAPTGSLPQARANLRLPGCMADGEGFDAGGEGEGWEPPLGQLARCRA